MGSVHAIVTGRDSQILTALDRCPHTLRQILKVSETFPTPFTSYRRVHQRLQALCEARWVNQWRYASVSGGAENYYTLTPQGYRYLHGLDTPLPGRSRFGPAGLARQPHTRALADFIVHSPSPPRGRGVGWGHHRVAIPVHQGSDPPGWRDKPAPRATTS